MELRGGFGAPSQTRFSNTVGFAGTTTLSACSLVSDISLLTYETLDLDVLAAQHAVQCCQQAGQIAGLNRPGGPAE
jgi:hypothetical protein